MTLPRSKNLIGKNAQFVLILGIELIIDSINDTAKLVGNRIAANSQQKAPGSVVDFFWKAIFVIEGHDKISNIRLGGA